MQIKPVASPAQVQQAQPSPQAQQSARAKAIAAFSGGQPAQQVVQNQSAVSAEEMGAIVPQKAAEETENLANGDSVEAPAESPKEEVAAAPVEAASPQLQALVRRERALRAKAQQQEAAFKAREAALAAKEAELAAKAPDLSKYIAKDSLKNNPLYALTEAGVSYDEITQASLNQGSLDPRVQAMVDQMKAEIRELKAANENTTKSISEQQTQAYKQAVKQIEMDTKKLVSSDPNFETIKATNSVSDVVELIEETFKKDGTLLSVEEAAQMVEDYLVEEALKITRINKIKSRLNASGQTQKASQQTQTAQPKQTQPQMKTLTNSNSSSRQLSAKERAILAFKGELPS